MEVSMQEFKSHLAQYVGQAQAGLEGEAELTVEGGALVLRQRVKSPRTGWAAASLALAEAGDDGLLMPEFTNEIDEELAW